MGRNYRTPLLGESAYRVQSKPADGDWIRRSLFSSVYIFYYSSLEFHLFSLKIVLFVLLFDCMAFIKLQGAVMLWYLISVFFVGNCTFCSKI